MSEKKYKCEFCDNNFKTKSSLQFHVVNAKYCKISQSKIIETSKDNDKDSKYEKVVVCKWCSTLFLKQEYLDIHNVKCKKRLQHEEEKQQIKNQKMEVEKCTLHLQQICVSKDMQISFLEKEKDRLEEMISEYRTREIYYHKMFMNTLKPNNDNNENDEKNQINKVVLQDKISKQTEQNIKTDMKSKNYLMPFDLTVEDIIEKYADLYTIDHFLEGLEGLLKWILIFMYKKEENKYMFICTDVSRLVFYYYDDKKIYTRDSGGKYFIELIYRSVIERVKKVFKEYCVKFEKPVEAKFDNDGQLIEESILKIKEREMEQNILEKKKTELITLKTAPSQFLKLYITKTSQGK